MIKLEQVNKTDNARRQIEGDRGNVLKSKKKKRIREIATNIEDR